MRARARPAAAAPPWWPATEPWPPREAGPWPHRRARFARRMALVFLLFITLSVTGAITLVSLLFRGVGIVAPPQGTTSWAIVALALLAVCALAFSSVLRTVARPVTDLVAAAGRVAAGDYGVRLMERGPRSIRSVARAFNSMIAQLQAQDEQRRHLMADIAHELRTPLTVMQGQLEGLLDGVYPRDDARLNDVLDHTRLLARLVEDLHTLAQADSGTLGLRKEPTDLAALVHDATMAFASDAAAANVALEVEDHEELPLVDLDPVRIREVLTNLLSNALRHSAPGGRIAIAMHANPDALVVRVRDGGVGIAPEALPRIFDRFYKGPTSKGSGLGLTIARNLVVAHGGTIAAESSAGVGTTMTFTLPRAPA
jgi:signal transduction histidine kinase